MSFGQVATHFEIGVETANRAKAQFLRLLRPLGANLASTIVKTLTDEFQADPREATSTNTVSYAFVRGGQGSIPNLDYCKFTYDTGVLHLLASPVSDVGLLSRYPCKMVEA